MFGASYLDPVGVGDDYSRSSVRTKLCDLLAIEHPILNAPMGYVAGAKPRRPFPRRVASG